MELRSWVPEEYTSIVEEYFQEYSESNTDSESDSNQVNLNLQLQQQLEHQAQLDAMEDMQQELEESFLVNKEELIEEIPMDPVQIQQLIEAEQASN
jgi:hypothetical protein